MDNKDESVSAADIEAVRKQLSQVANDPDLFMLECHCIDLDGFETGKIRSSEEWKEACKKCAIYIEFAARHPKHCPDHSE